MEKFDSLCVLLNSGNAEEVSQAQKEINNLFETVPNSEIVDFLIYEINENEISIYTKFTSMIMLSQIELNEIDLKRILISLFKSLETDNISLQNAAIKLFSKCFTRIINSNIKDENYEPCFNIINQLTDQIIKSIEIHKSIISVLFELLNHYHNDTNLSIFICSYLFQHMIETQPNEEIIVNHLIYLFSNHISFLFKKFIKSEEQSISLFSFIKTLLELDQYKNNLYLFLLKIAEFNYQLLEPIIDTFFQESLNDLSKQNDENEIKLTILNTWHLIFKNETKHFYFQSSINIVFEGIEILIKIFENEKIKEMRFETEWNESIACFKCLKLFSKCKYSLTTDFYLNYLNESDFNETSLLLIEIIVTSSPHDLIIESIPEFLKLINQSFQATAQEEKNELILFIQFLSIKCIRKIVKYFPDCFELLFPFVESIITFIDSNEETLALESLSTLSRIFCISSFQEKEKYINLIFENSLNMPPFISTHSIDSLIPIITTIDESSFFDKSIPIVLKLISETKDETCLDSLLFFLQKFVLKAGESISSYIQTIIPMLLQFIVENHSVVSILAVGSISSVSSVELIEPFIDDIFTVLSEIIISEGMNDKSIRNQCLSSLSLLAYPFNLSVFLDQIFEFTIKIFQNIESNEWNDFDFSSAAFLIDLYIPLIMNKNEIDESIMSNIFQIILHQISLIDFDDDDDEENIQFSEISFFLTISIKFIIQIVKNCQNLLSEDIFNLAFTLIEKATQLPSMNLSIKETIYDFYALLSQEFPSQLCTVFYQNKRVESFILNLISSNEFMAILSNKALRIQQK